MVWVVLLQCRCGFFPAVPEELLPLERLLIVSHPLTPGTVHLLVCVFVCLCASCCLMQFLLSDLRVPRVSVFLPHVSFGIVCVQWWADPISPGWIIYSVCLGQCEKAKCLCGCVLLFSFIFLTGSGFTIFQETVEIDFCSISCFLPGGMKIRWIHILTHTHTHWTSCFGTYCVDWRLKRRRTGVRRGVVLLLKDFWHHFGLVAFQEGPDDLCLLPWQQTGIRWGTTPKLSSLLVLLSSPSSSSWPWPTTTF